MRLPALLSKRFAVPMLGGVLFLAGPLTSPNLQDPKPSTRQVSDSQRARTPLLSDVFPRTRDFLKHLQAQAPELHAQLQEHSKQLGKDMESRALKLVEEHHPELREMLRTLQSRRRKRPYRSAMQDLIRDTARLEGLKQRSAAQYETSLAQWLAKSRVRMHSARLSAANSEDFEEQSASLRELVRKQVESDRSLHAQRAERLRKQLERVESQLAGSTEEATDREMKRIRSRIERRRKRR